VLRLGRAVKLLFKVSSSLPSVSRRALWLRLRRPPKPLCGIYPASPGTGGGTCLTTCSGISNRVAQYGICEDRLYMKERCFFGFMLPAGLLFAFPELSLVRCRWPQTTRIEEESGPLRLHSGGSMNNSNWLINGGALIPTVSDQVGNGGDLVCRSGAIR
jgi:hypothetical protein